MSSDTLNSYTSAMADKGVTMETSVGGPFSVYQFFSNDTHEPVRRNVSAEEAVKAAQHYMSCVGAQAGTTVRVMITDAEDFCTFDWKRGEGIVFPRPEDLRRD